VVGEKDGGWGWEEKVGKEGSRTEDMFLEWGKRKLVRYGDELNLMIPMPTTIQCANT
jgi:hypothetical protein